MDPTVTPAVPGHPWRRRWWPYVLGLSLAAFIAIAAGCMLLIRVPYVTLAPGYANPTEQLVQVNGADAYEADGEVLFTTVFLKAHVPLWRALQGWLDPTISVRPEENILGDRSPTEDRKFNLALMDDSKTVAISVALRHLGYPVTAHGSLIVDLQPDTDAATKLEPGDVITSLDGQPIQFGSDLRAAIGTHHPGDVVHLHIDPSADGSGPRDVDVSLAPHPEDATRPLLGVAIQDYNVEFPIDVQIDTAGIGGPSAGLAFTLAVLDVLTPGELTGGQLVAVTGTIDQDGNVGLVGGVAQKTEAVKRSGAKVFLVPPGEYEEAKAHAGKKVQVIPVATLEDALAALADLGGNALALPQLGAAPPA